MHSSIASFLEHLRTERGASAHTLRCYEDDLAQFMHYLTGLGRGEVDPTAVDARRLRAYSAWMNGQGLAPSTIARRLACLRSFFRHQRRQGTVAADPTTGLQNPKQPRRLPRPLPYEDVVRLLESIDTTTPAGVRDRTLLETMYGGGLRVSELVGLNLADLDGEQVLLRVRGKGRRERLCPIGAEALGWLGRWMALRCPRRPDEPPCFSTGSVPG